MRDIFLSLSEPRRWRADVGKSASVCTRRWLRWFFKSVFRIVLGEIESARTMWYIVGFVKAAAFLGGKLYTVRE